MCLSILVVSVGFAVVELNSDSLYQSANMKEPAMQPIIPQGNVLVGQLGWRCGCTGAPTQRNANSILVDGGDQF